jgi:hypothetical protein
MKPDTLMPAQAKAGAQAIVYPEDGTTSPFTVINLGSGKVKMGDAVHDGRLPALWFGKDGQGIGAEEVMNRPAVEGETLAVVTFSTVESLDVLAEVVQRIRGIAFPAAPAPGPQFQEDPMDIIRTLLCVVDRYWALPDEKRELYPSPTSECSPLMIAARRACVERGYTAGGLSIAAADGKAGAA